MDDFIRRTDAINAMANILVSPITSDNEFNIGIRRCMSSVNDIPAADVEEIVRCKNCVFWKEHDGFGKCVNPGSNIKSDVWLNPLFYCRAGVKAERRTE